MVLGHLAGITCTSWKLLSHPPHPPHGHTPLAQIGTLSLLSPTLSQKSHQRKAVRILQRLLRSSLSPAQAHRPNGVHGRGVLQGQVHRHQVRALPPQGTCNSISATPFPWMVFKQRLFCVTLCRNWDSVSTSSILTRWVLLLCVTLLPWGLMVLGRKPDHYLLSFPV